MMPMDVQAKKVDILEVIDTSIANEDLRISI